MTPIADLLTKLANLPPDWHGAGCLEMPNLEALARHAGIRRVRHSVETGAGKSTLLLSHLSEHHVVFAIDAGESLSKAADSSLLKKENVEFVDGPSQHTLMSYNFTQPLQLAFIDGPHGFPFPDMEYWKVYPHLEPGGLLVVDDIHIPTIRHLFDFLREDAMFTLLETVGKTAFFERTNAPTFSPVEDGWWLQNYNTRRFPVPYENITEWGTDWRVSLGSGEVQEDPAAYRNRLLPMIERWTQDKLRVAIFGVGGHTDFLWKVVPELWRLNVVAYLDSNPAVQGTTYREVAVQRPEWTPGQADVVLCSSFANELTQLALFDSIPVKVVLSHAVTRGQGLPAAASRAA
jgi:hypothetical protein